MQTSRFEAVDNALRTIVGVKAGGVIQLRSKPGCGLFGPYLDLPPGTCTARILLDGPRKGCVEMDISANHGQKILVSQLFNLDEGDVLELSIQLREPLHACEARLHCHEGVRANITGVEISTVPLLLENQPSSKRPKIVGPDTDVTLEAQQHHLETKDSSTKKSGVSADDVIAAIEMILGFTPDRTLVDYHLSLDFANRFTLGRYMLNTDEFRNKYLPGLRNNVFLGDRVLAFTHRGQIIYLPPSDLGLTPEILLHGTHEPHVEAVILASIRPGDTVIDLGANVGYHTLLMATAVGSAGHVHAFEANPEVMRLLRATMIVNRFTDYRGFGRVILYKHAVSDAPGTVTLASVPDYYHNGHVITASSSSDYGPEYSSRITVPAVTLDDILSSSVETADFIHMDIEGAEPLAIRGGQALIKRSANIKIVTEWAPHMMSTRAGVGELVAWLIDQQFKFWRIDNRQHGAELVGLVPSELATLSHCGLFISRQLPPLSPSVTIAAAEEQYKTLPTWDLRAKEAAERKSRLISFGPNACGLLVNTKNGLFVVDPEDSGVTGALLWHGNYNQSEFELAKSLISINGDVLVVGAHIGAHAVPLSRHCRNLIAMEANPHTFRLLQTNLSINNCDNVTAHNIAAGDKVEKIKFLLNRDNSGGSKRMPVSSYIHYVYDNPDVIEIDTIPLDSLLSDKQFDLILMDIEGSEYFALRGMKIILSQAKNLAVEFLPHHLRDVANIGPRDFIETILPYFSYMYIPGRNNIIESRDIEEAIHNAYLAGECHDGIYFSKKFPGNFPISE